MSEEEVLAIAGKYSPEEPISIVDAEKIINYCFKVRREKGCRACILRQRYGKGKKCPVVVSVA
ncbi:MAG: hypothetical protein QXX41_00335 [Nitrososphaerota archaeon]